MADPKQPSLAQRLMAAGIKKSHAYQLANGDRTPSLKLAIQIQEKTGIPVTAWPQPRAA